MAIACACDTGTLAMGLPSCYVIPNRIVKLIFTTQLTPLREFRSATNTNNIFVPISGPTNQPAWYYEDTTNPIPAAILSNFEFFLYYKDTYKLQTPLLSDFETERPDPVVEDVGGTAFYVRDADRTMTATLVAKPAEFLRFVELLRCQKELGVFLVDDKGIMWAARNPWSFTSARHISPIPIQPATIAANMMFPNATQVQKIMFSFALDRTFSDWQFVPVMNSDAYLNNSHPTAIDFASPIHLRGTARINAGDLELRLYYEIATAAGIITVPVEPAQVGTYLPHVYNASGTAVATNTAWTYVANGIYQISPAPTNAAYIAYDPSIYNTVPPINIDFYSLYVRL